MGHILSIRLSGDGCLGCGRFLPVVHWAAVQIHVQVRRCCFAASIETCFRFLGRNWRILAFGQSAHMTPGACENPSHIPPPGLPAVWPSLVICLGGCWLLVDQTAFGRPGLTASFCPGLWASCLLVWGWAKIFFHVPCHYGLLISFQWVQFISSFNLYVPLVLCWGPKLYMHILNLMFILWTPPHPREG